MENKQEVSKDTKDAKLSIAIMSGKGGVGKSNLALNIGCALKEEKFSTLLLDCDLGLANLDVLLGITPEATLQDVIQNNLDVRQTLVALNLDTDGYGNGHKFALLPSASGIPELADMKSNDHPELLARIEPAFEDFSILLLDLSAGIQENVQYFASMATVRLVVLTPEPASLTDVYALIKVLHTELAVKEFLVIVNQAETTKEAKAVFDRLAVACERFLSVTPVFLGSVRYEPKMSDAVRKQTPFIKLYPDLPATKDIKDLARKLTKIYATMHDNLVGLPALHAPKIPEALIK